METIDRDRLAPVSHRSAQRSFEAWMHSGSNREPLVHVLIVESSPSVALVADEALPASRYRVQKCQCLDEALQFLLTTPCDLVLLDLKLPDSDGLGTLEALRARNPQVAIIVLTGEGDEEMAMRALQEGALDYLLKGQIDPGLLRRAIRYAVVRMSAERKLRASEERFQELTANLNQVLWMIDAAEAKVLYVSPGYERIWGRSCQSLLQNPHSYMEGIHPADLEMMQREVAAMYQTGYIDAECRVARPDGGVQWIWVRGYPVKEGDRIVRLVGVTEDITAKRQLENERNAFCGRLQLHIARMPLAYVQFDRDLRIVDWNQSAERMFGYSRTEALGRGAFDLVPPTCRQPVEELLRRIRAGDMHAHSTNENLTQDGRKITCEWFNTPLMDDSGIFTGLLCLVQDVTERTSLRDRYHQAQKMEAIGTLAGGVAHDFNNLLTVISGYSEILIDRLAPTDPIRGFIQEIRKAGDRAALLTRQLLSFSRKAVVEPKVLDLNAIVTDTEKMLRRLIGEDISLSATLAPNLGQVKADAGQIEQVIMNLAVNARDAMPQGGRLTIETRNVHLDQTYAESHPEVKPGRYVMLAVSDTGCGMSQETQAHLFEPFFTTKGPGKGTGLGLATVFGIIQQSGGHIGVYSELGQGTAFKIYLPAVAEKASGGDSLHGKTAPRGQETILVVEDEDLVRAMTRLALQVHGYKVLEASNGKDAISVYEKCQEPIHLLITDVVMPGMSGCQLAEHLAASARKTKVLFLSGYTDDAIVRHGILQADVSFLQKPFTPLALANKVRELLD